MTLGNRALRDTDETSFLEIANVALGAALAVCAAGTANYECDLISKDRMNYVVPEKYQNHTCPRLKEEAERLSARINEVVASFEYRAVETVAIVTLFTLVYSPVGLLAVEASPAVEERDRLAEEHRDLIKVSIKKDCEWSRGQSWPMYSTRLQTF